MKLTNELYFSIRFARFCQQYGMAPPDLAELVFLARRAKRAGERACNEQGGSEGELKAAAAFEAKAKRLGFTVSWPGLWPMLHSAKGDVALP